MLREKYFGSHFGARKREIFTDYIKLLISDYNNKSKELYVYNAKRIKGYLMSKKALWKNVLSKSGELDKRLEIFLLSQEIKGKLLFDIYNDNKKILDIEELISTNN